MTNTCTKVFLRRRPYAGGKVSLYLDYYPAIRNPHTNKMTRRETLGIVIFAEPANEMQRRFNQEMEEKAEAIRCIRYQSLVNEQFGFLDKTKQKMDFLAYFEKKAKSKYDKWMSVYLHFKNSAVADAHSAILLRNCAKNSGSIFSMHIVCATLAKDTVIQQLCFRLLVNIPLSAENGI